LTDNLNSSDNTDGVMLQRPLTKKHEVENPLKLFDYIEKDKDVDALSQSATLDYMLSPKNSTMPCTPTGVLLLCELSGIELKGKTVAIVGQGPLVGAPLARILPQEPYNATVITIDQFTEHKQELCRTADVIITAVGCQNLISKADIVPGKSIVVDVGIVKDENNQVHGDLDPEVMKLCKMYTALRTPEGKGG